MREAPPEYIPLFPRVLYIIINKQIKIRMPQQLILIRENSSCDYIITNFTPERLSAEFGALGALIEFEAARRSASE